MSLEITLDGEIINVPAGADVRQIRPGVYSIIVGGKSYVARVLPGSDGSLNVNVHDARFAAVVRDPRNPRPRTGAALAAAHQDLRAVMPGKVVRVLVQEGDEVAAGQGLLIVEAMKMQNEVKSVRAGRVRGVRVKAADTVSAGDLLVSID